MSKYIEDCILDTQSQYFRKRIEIQNDVLSSRKYMVHLIAAGIPSCYCLMKEPKDPPIGAEDLPGHTPVTKNLFFNNS